MDLNPTFKSYEYWGSEWSNELITNSIGCKSDKKNLVAQRSQRNNRVLLIGDSFTEGVGVAYENTFAGILDRYYPNVEVLNGGVSTYSPKLDYLKAKFFVGRIGVGTG